MRRFRLARACFAAGALAGATVAVAESRDQFWPEIDAFFPTSEHTRVVVIAKGTRAEAEPGDRRSLELTQWQAGINLDVTLTPVFRTALAHGDWQRQRYLWMRVGYDHIASASQSGGGKSGGENRGIFELHGRSAPLAAGLELAARLRWEARDIDDVRSDRYRARLQVEKRFQAGGQPLIPFVNAEAFYDTRYDTWNRERYQVGLEIGLDRHWRVVPSLYHQNDNRSRTSNINALGLVLKYFH